MGEAIEKPDDYILDSAKSVDDRYNVMWGGVYIFMSFNSGSLLKFFKYSFCSLNDPLSIRGRYGTTKGINLVHASDSNETAEKEVKLWKESINIEEKDYKKDIMAYIRTYENFPNFF